MKLKITLYLILSIILIGCQSTTKVEEEQAEVFEENTVNYFMKLDLEVKDSFTASLIDTAFSHLIHRKYYIDTFKNDLQGIQYCSIYDSLKDCNASALANNVHRFYLSNIPGKTLKVKNRLSIEIKEPESPYKVKMQLSLQERREGSWRNRSNFGTFEYNMQGRPPNHKDLMEWMESTIVLCSFK